MRVLLVGFERLGIVDSRVRQRRGKQDIFVDVVHGHLGIRNSSVLQRGVEEDISIGVVLIFNGRLTPKRISVLLGLILARSSGSRPIACIIAIPSLSIMVKAPVLERCFWRREQLYRQTEINGIEEGNGDAGGWLGVVEVCRFSEDACILLRRAARMLRVRKGEVEVDRVTEACADGRCRIPSCFEGKLRPELMMRNRQEKQSVHATGGITSAVERISTRPSAKFSS